MDGRGSGTVISHLCTAGGHRPPLRKLRNEFAENNTITDAICAGGWYPPLQDGAGQNQFSLRRLLKSSSMARLQLSSSLQALRTEPMASETVS